MKVEAQIMMVMNLDKCLGCHTCSVACKSVWTNRPGTEYMWWNNVETKPGVGYPKEWEDQEKYSGGWKLKDGRLELRSGGKVTRLVEIFYNPKLPTLDDYYEPWTYDYESLTSSGETEHQPVSKPRSLLTGERIELEWGPNWEDDLAGGPETARKDPNLKKIEEEIKFEYEKAFMMYLPRSCNQCLNAACVAACPSGAIYKRNEDGIILIDENKCRGWRFCVSACPYKKVYFNWNMGKSEKCIFCYPRIEAGLPTVCSVQCVGKIRYLGVMLYDADLAKWAASAENEKELVQRQLSVFLDPNDPKVYEQARKDCIPEDWIQAAKHSPVYKLIAVWKVALPLHPEFRTLPMTWYVPPLSPLVKPFETESPNAADSQSIFPKIDKMRISIEYLASLFSAGEVSIVRKVLKKLIAMREYMRTELTHEALPKNIFEESELDATQLREMYRLLALSKYEKRFVIPISHLESSKDLFKEQGIGGFDFVKSSKLAPQVQKKG